MIPFKKEVILFVVVFWIICFFVGYKYSFDIKAVSPSAKIMQGTPQTVNNIASQQIHEVIQEIDPTEMEALSIETYYNPDVNSLTITSNNSGYSSCTLNDPAQIFEITNPDDRLALVNKQHKINAAYVPNDLVMLSDYGIPTTARVYLRQEPALKLKEMYVALSQAGFKIAASSGWRSLSFQQKVLLNWGKMVGAAKANMYAALPGFSEHHLGTAVDLLTPENGYTISPNYFNTKTFKWLADNDYKYGFVLSYPQGKEAITGYNPEGWHYRYIGVEAATEIHDQQTTLSEYLFKINNICY